MGFLDLIAWLSGRIGPDDPDAGPDPAAVAELAAGAEGDSVSAEALGGVDEQTNQPIAVYVEDDEQPHHVVRGAEVVMVDESDSVGRRNPSLETVVVATDERALVVVGRRVSDQLIEIPNDDIEDAGVEIQGHRRYLVIEADRDDDPMTFFVDVTLEPDPEAVDDAVAFLRDRVEAGTEPRTEQDT